MPRWNTALSALLVGASCVAGFAGNASAVTNVRTSATTFVSPASQTLAARSGGVNERAIMGMARDRYDVTVYQPGWRLGGKGASGRGPADRVEEHGLHVWMGFYENAFALMRRAPFGGSSASGVRSSQR